MEDKKVKEKLNLVLKDVNFNSKYTVNLGGNNVDVPVKYSDSRAFMALFPVSINAVKKILSSSRLEPISIFNGKCLLGITIFDYVTCPVGPYREIALSIPVKLDPKISIPILPLIIDPIFGKSSFYTILLAMNTSIGREHSEKIFGYPTYDKNIDVIIEVVDGIAYIKVAEGDEKILTIKMNLPKKLRIRKNKYNTYFMKEGRILNSELFAATYEAESGGKLDSVLDLGSHEISNIIKSLNVQKNPFRTIYYQNVVEVLSAPKEV